MENKKRAVVGLIAVLLLTLCSVLPVFAYTLPKPTDAFYTYDGANLLSAETENYIIEINEKLYEQTGAQVVVATVQTLEGASIEEYATDMLRTFGIGSAEKNNGVLLLMAYEERDVRIEVGYGLEGAINDGKAGRILDNYIIPFFKEGKWDEGMRNGFDAILQEINDEYDVEIGSNTPVKGIRSETTQSSDDVLPWGTPCMIAMGIGLVYGLLLGKLPNPLPVIGVAVGAVADAFYFGIKFSIWAVLVSLFGVGIWMLIGYAITGPEIEGSGNTYHSSGRSHSSHSSSSSYSSSSSSYSNHGGGGSSGGGGASRKF